VVVKSLLAVKQELDISTFKVEIYCLKARLVSVESATPKQERCSVLEHHCRRIMRTLIQNPLEAQLLLREPSRLGLRLLCWKNLGVYAQSKQFSFSGCGLPRIEMDSEMKLRVEDSHPALEQIFSSQGNQQQSMTPL
jgi:hypothetical protein